MLGSIPNDETWFSLLKVGPPGFNSSAAAALRQLRHRLRGGQLRLLAGVSREELGNPDAAAAAIRRIVRMMAAYTVVAGVTVFFVSVPSFIAIDGDLHTENFRTFLWAAVRCSKAHSPKQNRCPLQINDPGMNVAPRAERNV